MTDIVERLRLSVTKGHEPTDEDAIEAADEIERLREALQRAEGGRMSSNLVERLREQAWRRSGAPKMDAGHTKMLEWEAADVIERLRAISISMQHDQHIHVWRAHHLLRAQLIASAKAR